MSAVSMEERLLKMREERAAREKARIEKLRELNLKKYNKPDHLGSLQNLHRTAKSNNGIKKFNHVKNDLQVNTRRPLTAPNLKTTRDSDLKLPKGAKTNYLQKNIDKCKTGETKETKHVAEEAKNESKLEKNANKNLLSDNFDKKLVTDKVDRKLVTDKCDKKLVTDKVDRKLVTDKCDKKLVTDKVDKKLVTDKVDKRPIDKNVTQRKVIKTAINNKINNDKLFDKKLVNETDKILAEIRPFKKIDSKLTRKSMGVFHEPRISAPSRKSMMPKIESSRESVFDRLYKSKTAPKNIENTVEKLQTDPTYLKKVIKHSNLIMKRHSCFDNAKEPVRRSISAVHFKRIGKNEMSSCIHKWASTDKLNHLTIDEGEKLKEDKVISAVKSERKKVTFWSPMAHSATPRPDELQARLKSWLQKRGKSLDSYQHLQCFGIHHFPRNMKFNLEATPNKTQLYDEENKENIAVDSDSDDGSYTDNMTNQKQVNDDLNKQKDALTHNDMIENALGDIDIDRWRQTSFAESVLTDMNETADLNETTITSADTYININDLLIGALNDLTELLKEGFGWEQAARYLRAIRCRFPDASRTAAYWECRAALEERRGDLHASVECWEEAIAKGTERNVVEASLDTLLNKFMQLKIGQHSSPAHCNSKMVDVKNVFKSTIIRFAVQQAKLRQSEAPVFTVTPVRRSGRLSHCPTSHVNTPRVNTPRAKTPRANTPRLTPRIPLRVCESVKQVSSFAPQHVFTPNENLVHTP